MRTSALASALLLATLSQPGLAQSQADHQAHHPDQKETPVAKPTVPPESPRGAPSQGMMGGGMRDMMGAGMPMSDMMRMMGMMRQSGGDGMGGMETIDRVEGRIAFLRTELKITDAQQSSWNAFADALRTNAKTLGDMRSSMMSRQGAGAPGLVEKLALQEKWIGARLEGTRAMRSALLNLIETLSDEQKKTADELLAPNMGIMPMMMQGGRKHSMQMQGGE